MRRGAALLAVLVLAAAVLTAGCSGGGSGQPARLDDPLVNADPLLPTEKPELEPMPDPEVYGLPPLATLQANPTGVSGALLARQAATTWTVTWKVKIRGDEAGEVVLEHLPPDAKTGAAAKLHIEGLVGIPGQERQLEFEILDEGQGARICGAENGSTVWVCDLKDSDVALKFLSTEGLATLGELLRQLLAFPGLSVQYYKVGGAPSACFYFAPAPSVTAEGQNLGVDVSDGGEYCLSTNGAITRLATGDMAVTASEYKDTANPSRFRLPMSES